MSAINSSNSTIPAKRGRHASKTLFGALGASIFFASSHLNAEIFCRRIRRQCGQQLGELERNDLKPLPLSLVPSKAASERHLHP
jgi:hypothetical protein